MLVKIKPLGISAQKITRVFGMMTGLMFSRKRNLLFAFKKSQRVGIHMLFVFFPIIAVWLDEKKRIKAVRVMKPFLSYHEEDAKYVLEIPYNQKILRKLRRRSLRF